MHLAIFWGFFFELICKFGPIALFVALLLGIVGLPLPDELLLTVSGYLIAHNKLNLAYTVIAAILGSMCGITLSYLLGRLVGKWFVRKFGAKFKLTPERIALVKMWFLRVGKWLLIFGYFVPIFRHLCGFVAGGTRLSYRDFALFAYTGAILWSLTFLTIGYYSHQGIHEIHRKYLESRQKKWHPPASNPQEKSAT